MRKLIYILSVLCLAAACVPQERRVEFGVSGNGIEADSAGGTFDLSVSSSDAWTAMSDNPWITVSPANGISSADCKVMIDSTLVSGERKGVIRFRNIASGENMDVQVSQSGFAYKIGLDENTVSINHYKQSEDRTFEVTVRSNVPFNVVIPNNAKSWLSCEEPEFDFNRGARPRDIKLKFTWNVNSVPMEREAFVEFVPKPGYGNVVCDKLNVKQSAAPVIVPGHAGDSITVLSLSRNLNMFQGIVSAEPMSSWDNVVLWEDTDEGFTPEKKGRVRRAAFTLFATDEGIPYEVQYLTEAEELTFFSNVNSFLYNIDLGEYICKLTNLKRLTVSSYGVSKLPESFKNLRKLEYLDLSGNNFDTLPDVISKENFPELKALMLNTCQRYYVLDLSNDVRDNLAGFHGKFPRRLLEWENLEKLRLSVNFIEGEMPDMLDYEVKYTEDDCKKMNLPPALIGTPKVLPNCEFFAFNLNRMSGKLPDWVLYHPHLTDWEPYTLCYSQEGRAADGTLAAFSNVPVNMDYYWNFYDGYKDHVDIYLGD